MSVDPSLLTLDGHIAMTIDLWHASTPSHYLLRWLYFRIGNLYKSRSKKNLSMQTIQVLVQICTKIMFLGMDMGQPLNSFAELVLGDIGLMYFLRHSCRMALWSMGETCSIEWTLASRFQLMM
ncbi:hypothetical protein C5167_035176 [Papaver somniferum]|uniref:Uncharacterized protein n=1 Tax=Papaver somniferum TaxID=3469 RepID=A0A4Y7KF67_PAPSO|nr:hypothetical protein C5167_035176 [Papaver somniferum]